MRKWAYPTLTCTSCHVYRGQVQRSVHIQNKLFPQLGSRDVEFSNPCTQQHQRRPAEADQEIFAAPACPAGICHGEIRPLFGWVPSPPKNVGSSGQQMSWHRFESFFLRHCEGKRRRGLPSTRACSSWKWNPGAAAPGATEGRAWVPQVARVPQWGIHIQTKSTFIYGINGVKGGGGSHYRCTVTLFSDLLRNFVVEKKMAAVHFSKQSVRNNSRPYHSW